MLKQKIQNFQTNEQKKFSCRDVLYDKNVHLKVIKTNKTLVKVSDKYNNANSEQKNICLFKNSTAVIF